MIPYGKALDDDEELIRNAIFKMIDWHSLGCEVIATARNGSEAYQIYLDSYPEIIITDLLMPVMNGIEFMERIREKDKDVKVIVLSGYGEFEYAQKAIRLGARDYILKPAGVEDMSALIMQCVKEIEADKAKKLFHSESVDFFRIILLEMINAPHEIESILARYFYGYGSYGGAVVVGTSANGCFLRIDDGGAARFARSGSEGNCPGEDGRSGRLANEEGCCGIDGVLANRETSSGLFCGNPKGVVWNALVSGIGGGCVGTTKLGFSDGSFVSSIKSGSEDLLLELVC